MTIFCNHALSTHVLILHPYGKDLFAARNIRVEKAFPNLANISRTRIKSWLTVYNSFLELSVDRGHTFLGLWHDFFSCPGRLIYLFAFDVLTTILCPKVLNLYGSLFATIFFI